MELYVRAFGAWTSRDPVPVKDAAIQLFSEGCAAKGTLVLDEAPLTVGRASGVIDVTVDCAKPFASFVIRGAFRDVRREGATYGRGSGTGSLVARRHMFQVLPIARRRSATSLANSVMSGRSVSIDGMFGNVRCAPPK